MEIRRYLQVSFRRTCPPLNVILKAARAEDFFVGTFLGNSLPDLRCLPTQLGNFRWMPDSYPGDIAWF
jgi:hypothetical protein